MTRNIDVVVGGQYGSEGKGKVAYHLLKQSKHKCGIRVGGPNSGHTANCSVLRQLPMSALLHDSISIIAAGSYVNVGVLLKEIQDHNPHILLIDSKAIIITEVEDKSLNDKIGSTLTGTGIAVADRINRVPVKFVGEDERLKQYVVSTSEILAASSEGAVIEGTQGFGLSNIHTECYPYATSRDTTASGFLSEVGIGPLRVKDVYVVIRSYPIRVAGNSGPLACETSWEEVGVPEEHTTVTGKVRRVGQFTAGLVRKAITVNSASKVVLNHLDYIEPNDRLEFVRMVQLLIGNKIDYVGLGPDSFIKTEEIK